MPGGHRAGLRNRKIEFHAPSTSTDHTGQEIKTYALAYSMMAQVRGLRGAEMSRFMRIEAAREVKAFTVHYTDRIDVRQRIKYNGKFFDILEFAEGGNMNRRFVTIYAEVLETSGIEI